MTFERACELLYFTTTPDVRDADTRAAIIETVVGLSADGTLPVDRGRAGLIRVEIEMFA
jgi:hypothetical protein